MSSSTTTAWMEQKQLEEITENHRLSLRVFLHYLDETMQTTDNAHALLSALCNSYLDDKI